MSKAILKAKGRSKARPYNSVVASISDRRPRSETAATNFESSPNDAKRRV